MEQVRPIEETDLGIRVLYDGTGNASQAGDLVDIVAVHGMGAHPEDTWSKQVGEHAKGPVYVNWLKDQGFLPAAVPRARIMRYGYNSRWFGPEATKTKLSTIGQRFLTQLERVRRTDQNRPLILIGHDFGGLVILRLLIDAYIERARWPGIYDSAGGLVFLGTPFRGTDDSLSQGEILQHAQTHFAKGSFYKDNLEIFRQEGESLSDLLETYSRIARQHEMPSVACFYEQQPSKVGRILQKDLGEDFSTVILVSEGSGCLDLTPKTEKHGLERDHFNIHKFGSPEESSFMDVRDVIVRMAQEGPSHSKAEQPLGEMAQKGPSFSETEQPLGRRMEDISDEIS